MQQTIDYTLLAQTIAQYTELGYEQIVVPWSVPNRFIQSFVQRPVKLADSDISLIGSAEQSFAMLADTGLLEPCKKYMSVTPCFRNESVIDELHQEQFIKLELFLLTKAQHKAHKARQVLAEDAMQVLSAWAPARLAYELTEIGLDITLDGIEIGSYNVCTTPAMQAYACGTGLALPRFTIASSKALSGACLSATKV